MSSRSWDSATARDLIRRKIGPPIPFDDSTATSFALAHNSTKRLLAIATRNAWTAGRKPRHNQLYGWVDERQDRPRDSNLDEESACRLEDREADC